MNIYEGLDFDVTIIRETDAAYLVEYQDDDIWLPKSRTTIDGDFNGKGQYTIGIPRWLADEKGMV